MRRWLSTREGRHLLWGALIYLALALAYNVVALPFESPDEVGHFFAVKYIADHGRLPDPDRVSSQQYLYGQEGTQPPLYYLIGAALVRLSGIDTSDAQAYLRVNPHTTCGSPHLSGNKAFLAHDPAQERFPWRGALLALHLLRLYSTALGLLTALGVYGIGRLVFPDRHEAALLAAGATALNPQFVFVTAAINNDNLLVMLCTWALFFCLRTIRGRLTVWNSLLMGALTGLAALTKLGGALLLPMIGLAILTVVWTEWRQKPKESRSLAGLALPVLRHAALAALPALVFGAWWYIRNAVLYADPTLIEHHLAIVSRRDPTPLAQILHEVPSIFYSYWGRFTCDVSPGGWYYAFWGGLVVLGLAAVGAGWARFTRVQRISLLLLAVWFILVFVGWFRWNLLASGVQGRLLFPATASMSVLVAVGLSAVLRRRKGLAYIPLACWLGLALWALFGLIWPTFAPPQRYADVASAAISQPTAGRFEDGSAQIELVGAEIQPGSLEPGETMEVVLYLSTQEPMTDTYSIGLWLVSAIPGDTTRLAGLDTWPGNGSYPTNVWRPGEVVRDAYRIIMPAEVARSQAWTVQVNVYWVGQSGWLPFFWEGQPAGDRAVLGVVRVGASQPVEVPAQSRVEPSPVFGDSPASGGPPASGGMIALQGAEVTGPDDEGGIAVTLWWRALATPAEDYTVFVHLVDDDGNQVGSGDGPPLEGGFPTRLWQPGDTVMDEHRIQLASDLPSGHYRLRVGWYQRETGARLALNGGDSFELPHRIDVP
ncbi:MAG: hypothetical protein GX601_06840 [Anaerolineales bacterium]|nr:hypothetical protein [Anaerolineales bacterium]